MLPAAGNVPIVPALWDTPWMFRIQRRKADDFDEGRAADSALGGNRVPFRAQIPGRSFPEGLDRENTSQSECLFRDAVSARGPFGKSWPVSAADSGMRFPLETSTGNRASRFDVSEWDAVSPRGPIGKLGTGIRLSSGMQFPQQTCLGNGEPDPLAPRCSASCLFAKSNLPPLQQSVD